MAGKLPACALLAVAICWMAGSLPGWAGWLDATACQAGGLASCRAVRDCLAG